MSTFSYTVDATERTETGTARAGSFTTPHGDIKTPIFMPVGTHSAVRTLTWGQVHATGAQIILSNAYHLYLRPGTELVKRAGGLHKWSSWNKPILTDSGGFQVFSLAKFRKITDEGVHFQDPLTGDKHFIGPKESMQIQSDLGADIIMAFDECPPYPATREYTENSLKVTHRWLEQCFKNHDNPQQALFPIVQGGTYEDLRTQSAEFVQQFDAIGYAIGGVSVGEPKELIDEIVRYTTPLLPDSKPRYLMGVGTPIDLLDAIRSGIDMFDCVMPTRIARHGSFFSWEGRKIIKNEEFKEDFSPLVEGCGCYACQNHHRAYIRHLFRQKEFTAGTLLSIHNIYFLIQLSQLARQHIIDGTFEDFYHQTAENLNTAKLDRATEEAVL